MTMQTVIDRIVDRLVAARDSATLKNASFGFPTEMVSSNPHCDPPIKDVHVDKFIKDKVSLHHETWIVAPLNDAIALLKGQQELISILGRITANDDLRHDLERIDSLLTANRKAIDRFRY
jgi:hypothetical protein